MKSVIKLLAFWLNLFKVKLGKFYSNPWLGIEY